MPWRNSPPLDALQARRDHPLPRRPLGRTGLLVSALGFGAAPLGFAPDLDERTALAVLHRALDLGINFYDTVPEYRRSEELLGQAFAGRRSHVLLATKVGRLQIQDRPGRWQGWEDWSADGVRRTIEASLRRLRTDYLDLVQLHSPPLHVLAQGEALRGLEQARAQGTVRFLGLSADGAVAQCALQMEAFSTLQISYNVLHQEPNQAVLEAAWARGVGLIIKQPVANGLADGLQHPAPPEWGATWELAQRMDLTLLGPPGRRTEGALRWLLADPRLATAIVGTTQRAHLERNVAAAAQPLEAAVCARLRQSYQQARALGGPACVTCAWRPPAAVWALALSPTEHRAR